MAFGYEGGEVADVPDGGAEFGASSDLLQPLYLTRPGEDVVAVEGPSISTSCPPDSVGAMASCLARVTSLSRRGPKPASRMPRVPQAISRTSLTWG